MKQIVLSYALTLSLLFGLDANLSAAVGLAAQPQQPATSSEPTPASEDTATKSDNAKSESKSDPDKATDKKDKDKSPESSADKDKSKDKGKNVDAAKKNEAKKDDAAKKESTKADAKPEAKRKTYKVEPKHLRIDLSLDGTFLANKMTEVPLRPDSWSDYEIVEVAPLGAKVRKGETLFKFDAKKINEAIEDLELEQRLNELAIVRAEEEMPRLEKTLKLDADDADRTLREAKEDLVRYNEQERPMMAKTARFMLKYYGFMLDYEKDELNQLEKMYKADDLTEETEEIVLKRQRNAVEFAEFSLESAKLNSDEMLNVRLPRMDAQVKNTLDRADIARARAQMALSLDLTRARYELEQRKKARTKSLDKHSKLLADRELMEIKAPADGVVYYGQCLNGRWSDANMLENKYQPHNNVTGGSILMTIVDERPLSIIASLDEANRPEVSADQKVRIALPAEAADRINGKVKSVSPIPVSTGKFETMFDVEDSDLPSWIVAGLGCKVNVTTYDKADAVVVPKKAVHDDEVDPEKHYVWLLDSKDEKAKPQRRDVTLGKAKGDELEIRKGLEKGNVISLDDEKDKDDKTEDKD
jgi:multidrug resistance efflux pump